MLAQPKGRQAGGKILVADGHTHQTQQDERMNMNFHFPQMINPSAKEFLKSFDLKWP